MKNGAEEWFPEYVTTGFVSRYCGVSSTTALRWIKKGLLHTFVLPSGHYRIHRDDFKRFLMDNRILFRKEMH